LAPKHGTDVVPWCSSALPWRLQVDHVVRRADVEAATGELAPECEPIRDLGDADETPAGPDLAPEVLAELRGRLIDEDTAVDVLQVVAVDADD
jgi:hypothetical protein